MFYLVKPPALLKRIYKDCIWSMPCDEKLLYLTFDDGPHPSITAFVLEELKKYNAKATFFCLGKNVQVYPDIYKRIIEEGHSVGNHTFNHLNGWNTGDTQYLHDIAEAKKIIHSNLYRPPYGKIKRSQLRKISLPPFSLKTIMWNVLSGDFDMSITGKKCLQNVVKAAKAGSVVVFHDSEKANERLRYALPEVLLYFIDKGYRFEKINLYA